MYRTKLILLFSLCLFFFSGYSQKAYYVSTAAGDTADIPKGADSNAGWRDGIATYAKFNGPTAVATDTMGNVYIADTYNNVIRKLNTTFNMVTTIAGDTTDIKKGLDSNIGFKDGTNFVAKFKNPLGICVDKFGNLYIADTYNNVIREILVSGGVISYAGNNTPGYVNGPAAAAEFYLPIGIAVDNSGNIFVADEGNNAIREIVKATDSVITVAGLGPDSSGYVNGQTTLAQFSTLYGIALGKKGDIYASQFGNGVNAIRHIYNDTATTFAGYVTYGFDTNLTAPVGYKNGKCTPGFDTAVLFNGTTGIAFDTAGNLLVADEFNNVIRLVNTNDSVVTTLAGNPVASDTTYLDGWHNKAKFFNPMGVTADNKGNVYVADLGNNLIRKINLQTVTAIPAINKDVTSMHVYPNPCSDRLNIVSSFNGKAELLDVTGRIIWSNNDFKSPAVISTSTVTPGVYFLKVSSLSSTEIQKIEVVK